MDGCNNNSSDDVQQQNLTSVKEDGVSLQFEEKPIDFVNRKAFLSN